MMKDGYKRILNFGCRLSLPSTPRGAEPTDMVISGARSPRGLVKKIFWAAALIAALLAPSRAALADDEWRCMCGCNDPVCPNIAGACFGCTAHIQPLFEPGRDMYDDVETASGTITHDFVGITVDPVKRNNSWTYSFEIHPSQRHYLRWDAELEVLQLHGRAMAGITMDRLDTSIAFRVDRMGRAQIAYLALNESSEVIDDFMLPPDVARRTSEPFVIGISYDIRMDEFVCAIDGVPVRSFVLPYCGMPAFASVVGFSMETTTHETTSDGKVIFGAFVAEGGR